MVGGVRLPSTHEERTMSIRSRRLTPKRRTSLEEEGQLSFLGDLDALIDAMLERTQPGNVVWSDGDIHKLKTGILLDALKQLRQVRLAQRTRDELMSWIAEPLQNGGYARPFSFEDCCLASDMNPQEMQPHLLRMFPTH